MKIFLIVILISAGIVATAAEIKEVPLDFTLVNSQLKKDQIMYGWKLMPWQDWIKRPSSGPLLIKTKFNKNDIEVFEARAATIVLRPASFFTQSYLHNIDTIRKLNPQNHHELVIGQYFTVITQMSFPPYWAELIEVAKKAKLLDDKTTDYIRMESAFAYASRNTIEGSQDLQRIIKLLDISKLKPEAINLQGTLKVNQIADFISIVTVFYKVNEQQTLVVTYMAVALKKHLLNLGVNARGVTLNGRSILLGQNSVLNSEKGISAGLPKYFLEFFDTMTHAF